MKAVYLYLLCVLSIFLPHYSMSSEKTKFEISYKGDYKVCADRLFSEYIHLIEGKRLALVSNHTGRLSNGKHIADMLHDYQKAELMVLFGMYHNIRILDYSVSRDPQKSVDTETGLIKYSLYFDIHKPTKEMLKDIDLIIFDIQEVGVRFFEHINVLGFVMEAAAENDIEILVLDRPNPISGLIVDGFVSDNEYLYRFNSYGKLPAVHGMTIGEIALMYNGEKMLRGGATANLHVIKLKGWQRSKWFDEIGDNWLKPSPNLITLQSVIAYASTCLFEGLTNISEGRGTDKPFEYIGAPWVDHKKVADLLNELKLPGVNFEPVEFIPERKPFHGSEPLYSGQLCRGIHINIIDRNQFEPFKVGIAMLLAIQILHPDEVIWNAEIINKHAATSRLMQMIKDGKKFEEIYTSWKPELHNFKEVRKRYLFYD
jgi:uncharacterized protein YbbC (DUF1343 family)